MEPVNFNNRKFALIDNSSNGEVNTDTIFNYQQEGDLVTADYKGGSIEYGKIIGRLENDQLHMLYHCMTTDKVLKAGKAIADISYTYNGRIILTLDWEWLTEHGVSGTSSYMEM